ncbi:hypothetical protein BH10BAC5_BH10BAC5_23440 [soil metagenome]
MKIFKTFLLLLITIAFIQNSSSAQVSFSAGPSIGLTIPSGDYSGSTLDYYSGTKFGLSSGINFGAVVRANLTAVNFKLKVNYSALKNSGNSEPGKGDVQLKQNLLMVSVGPEYRISIPGSPIKPYIGANLIYTSFSGETSFTGVEKVSSGTYQLQSASRTGLGLDLGVMFAVGTKSMLDLGLSYNAHNLFGKSFTGADRRLDSYTSLNDEKDPQFGGDKHPIGSSRTISTLQFNLSYLFNL